MKAKLKLIGVIALIAVIGFGVIACGGGDDKETVATPTATPGASTVTSGTTVTLATTTEGASIYYTTDGSAPTASSTKYASPIAITSAVTIKAIGVKDGMNNSAELTAAYFIAIEKITLTNVPVTLYDTPDTDDFNYYWDSSAKPLSDIFTGTPNVKVTTGGSGGTLTLELDKPKDGALRLIKDELFEGITLLNDTTKCYLVDAFCTSNGGFFLGMDYPGAEKPTYLLYVDNDVTLNGEAENESEDEDGNTINILIHFNNVTLKKGWNYLSITSSESLYVVTASQTQPAGATWTVWND